MIELSRLTVLILAELLLGLGLVTLVLISMAVIRKHKTYQAAQQLVERIRLDTVPRSERLRRKLSGGYGYDGEALDQILHDLTRVEKQLYQNIINGFLKRDLHAFQQIDVDVDNLVLAYQDLEPSREQHDAVSNNASSDDVDREEIERLHTANRRLADELKVTMETMAHMISEYATMFSSQTGTNQNEEHAILVADKIDDEAIEQQREEISGEVPDTATEVDGEVFESDTDADIVVSLTGESSIAEGDDTQASEDASGKEDEQIVDEVLEVADEFSELVVDAMNQMDEIDEVAETPQGAMVDEMEQVDISSAEFDEDPSDEAVEPGSLEDEWAKLLEDEAHAAELDDMDDEEEAKRG